MERTRVLYIVDQLGGGGAERVVVDIATHLPPSYQCHVCATRENGNFSYCSSLEQHGVPYTLIGRRKRYDLRGFQKIRQLICDYQPHIIHTHKYGSNIWGRLLRISTSFPVLVSHEHTWEYNSANRLRILTNRILAPLSDAIIAVSEEDRRKLIAVEALPENKILTIYNGVDFSRIHTTISSSQAKRRFGIEPEEFSIGIIGKLSAQKGHEYLLQALAIARDALCPFKLLIAGEGELREELENLVIELGLERSVSFLGFVNDIGVLLSAVDLVVMPSLFEGHPIALIEAMAAGKAVVASDVGGIPEVIEPGKTGTLVPPRDTNGLASAISAARNTPQERIRLGEAAARSVTSRFSIEAAVQSYVALYKELLGYEAE